MFVKEGHMGKHVPAEVKLHTTPAPKSKRQPPPAPDEPNFAAPPKGTNSNNQFR